jgi:hypothetical protein
MANVKQQLEVPSIPSLGFAPEAYERRHFSENYGALNVYFRKLVSALGALFGPQGGKFINNPYGAFQDSTDQTAANTTTAYAVSFNTTDFAHGVTLANSTKITVGSMASGTYSFQFNLRTPPMTARMWTSGFARTARMWTTLTADSICLPGSHRAIHHI